MTKRNALLSFERSKHEIERRKMLEEITKLVQSEIKIKEERMKEHAIQKMLKHLGVCVMGYR
jgi:hypothetical protein